MNAVDIGENTALMYAVRKGYAEIARLLIEAGADVNMRTDWGTTALQDAKDNEQIDIVNLLIEAGAQE